MLTILVQSLRAVFDEVMAWLDDILPFRSLRARNRCWRRTRPFWGGALVIAGGAAILLVPLAPLPVMIHVGMAAVSGVAIGFILIVAGLFFWFAPQQRMFIAIVTSVCSLVSFVTSNLGGLGIGMLLGLIGSSMAFGWKPHPDSPEGQRLSERARARALRLNPLPRPDLAPRRTLALLPAAVILATTTAASPAFELPPWLLPLFPAPTASATPSPAPVPSTAPTAGPTVPTAPSEPSTGPTGTPSAVPSGGSSATPSASPSVTMTAPPKVETDAGAELFGENVPEVSADSLQATDFTFKGSTTMPTVSGPIQVLVFHAEKIVAKNYQVKTNDPGPVLTLSSDLDIDDVTIYATHLGGTITIPYLDIPLLTIDIGADLIPTWLPLEISLPVFSGLDIKAGQVMIDAKTVRATGLQARLASGQ